MAVVSVRLRPETAAALKRHGISAGKRARELLEEEARRLRLLDAQNWLDEHQEPAPGAPAEDTLRRDRDTDHGRRD